MKNPLFRILLILSIFGLPTPVIANPSLHYLGPLDSTIDPSAYSAVQGEFVVGQRVPVAGYAVDDRYDSGFPHFPNYSIVPFCPGQTPEVPCTTGWRINAVHFVFASQILEPTAMALRFDLAEGYQVAGIPQGLTLPWTDGTDPLLPTVTVPGAGYYELVVPSPDWGCLYLDYWYGISQTESIYGGGWPHQPFQYAIDESYDLSCPDLRSYTMGALILFDILDLPGDLVMWVDASCCENPVALETLDWGGLKVRYR